jgi:hypothetical protein
VKKSVSAAVIAAILTAGTMASAPSVASAQEIQFNLGHHRPPPPDYQQDDDDDDNGPPPPPRYGMHRPPPPDFDRPPPGRGCDPHQAVDMASRSGLRHAHVVDISPRRITIDGFTRRGPDEMVFGNVRGCPNLD